MLINISDRDVVVVAAEAAIEPHNPPPFHAQQPSIMVVVWGKKGIWYSIVMMLLLLTTAVLLAPATGLHMCIAGHERVSRVKFSAVPVRSCSQTFDFRVRGEAYGVMNETNAKGDRHHHQSNRVRVLCCYCLHHVQNANHHRHL